MKNRVVGFAVLVFPLALACVGGPSMECQAYVECYEKMGVSSESLLETYGEDGTCWRDSAVAASCTSSCAKALEGLRKAYPDAGC